MNNSISPGSLKDRINTRIDSNNDANKNYKSFLNQNDRKIINQVKDEDLRRIYSDGENSINPQKPKNFELPS